MSASAETSTAMGSEAVVEDDPIGIPRPGALSELVAKPWFWGALVGLLFALVLVRALSRKPPRPPPALFNLPRFSLTDQDGHAYGTPNLSGKVWVADFFFTSCPTVCPKLSRRMQQLQRRTRGAASSVHLVSFSVDPENDTPDRLRTYAKGYRANPRRWTFLTGDSLQVDKTIVEGFRLAMGREATKLHQIFHSERFVLVDRRMRVRGLYDATDAGIEELLADIGLVLNLPDQYLPARPTRVTIPGRPAATPVR